MVYGMSGEDKDLVIVQRFPIRPQADRAKQLLEVAGIESFIQGDDAGGWVPPLGFATGGIAVLVPSAQAAEAKKVLEGIDSE